MGNKNALSTARLLLVDDDPDFLLYVEALFRHVGTTEIETVRSGLEALERIAEDGAYDLVVTDVRMPAPSGTQLVTMARTAGYSVPFLVVTAFPDRNVYNVVDALEDTDVLGKPFSPEDLMVKASELLAKIPEAA